MSKGITVKELRIAAKNVNLQYGVIDILINEAIRLRRITGCKDYILPGDYPMFREKGRCACTNCDAKI